MGMALMIHAVKLEIHHGEIVAVHIINGGLNQVIILGVVFINAQAIFDDTEVHIVPIAEGSQLRVGLLLPDYPEHRRIG